MKLHHTVAAAGLALAAGTLTADEARAQEPADSRLRILVTDEAGAVDTMEYVRLVRGEDGRLYIVDPELAVLQVQVTPVEPAQGYEAPPRPGDTAAAAGAAAAAGGRQPALVITKEPMPGMGGSPAPFRDDDRRVRLLVPTGRGEPQALDYEWKRSGDGYELVPPGAPDPGHQGDEPTDEAVTPDGKDWKAKQDSAAGRDSTRPER